MQSETAARLRGPLNVQPLLRGAEAVSRWDGLAAAKGEYGHRAGHERRRHANPEDTESHPRRHENIELSEAALRACR